MKPGSLLLAPVGKAGFGQEFQAIKKDPGGHIKVDNISAVTFVSLTSIEGQLGTADPQRPHRRAHG